MYILRKTQGVSVQESIISPEYAQILLLGQSRRKVAELKMEPFGQIKVSDNTVVYWKPDEFKPDVVACATTGIAHFDGNRIGELYEFLQAITGVEVYTHMIPEISAKVCEHLRSQLHPDWFVKQLITDFSGMPNIQPNGLIALNPMPSAV